MPLSDAALIDRFLEMLAAEAGAARNTVAAYRSDLALASAFLEGRLASADADALARLAHDWRDLARATVARKAAALRRFYVQSGVTDDSILRLPVGATGGPEPVSSTR